MVYKLKENETFLSIKTNTTASKALEVAIASDELKKDVILKVSLFRTNRTKYIDKEIWVGSINELKGKKYQFNFDILHWIGYHSEYCYRIDLLVDNNTFKKINCINDNAILNFKGGD